MKNEWKIKARIYRLSIQLLASFIFSFKRSIWHMQRRIFRKNKNYIKGRQSERERENGKGRVLCFELMFEYIHISALSTWEVSSYVKNTINFYKTHLYDNRVVIRSLLSKIFRQKKNINDDFNRMWRNFFERKQSLEVNNVL